MNARGSSFRYVFGPPHTHTSGRRQCAVMFVHLIKNGRWRVDPQETKRFVSRRARGAWLSCGQQRKPTIPHPIEL